MTRVLIADDNEKNLYLLEAILKGNGLEVTAAKNGAEALELAQKSPPDLVVADILMPVMDGFELCRQWKKDERLKSIPFMFYTATYTDPKDERFAMSLGADRFVIKPQKPEVLAGIIGEILREPWTDRPVPDLNTDEDESLKQYNEVLFRKLEKKMKQLEDEIAGHLKAEEELRSSETRYRKLYESMMDAFVTVDMGGRIQLYNRSFSEMLGYTGEELCQLTYRDLSPEKWHSFEKFVIETQVLPRGYSEVFETEYRKKDGTVFPVELRVTVIRDESGQPSGMWAIVRDISDRRRAEEKIRMANRKLALMNDVTYQDIQNKVTGLRGYVELSEKDMTDTERQEYFRKEKTILKSIHDLIKNTKDYQQMGVGECRWIPLEQTLRFQFSRISQKHQETLDCDVHGFEIHADPLIDRVFYNLMQNALIHGEKLTRVSWACHETSDGMLLICEDDGVGIATEQKPFIFDRVVGGKGKFGLFFVREFLTLSGMTIRETGIPGRGARFEIAVPKGMYRFASGNREDTPADG